MVTAAHCVDGAKEAQVLAGAHKWNSHEANQQRIFTYDLYNHENWDTITLENDIGIVRTPHPFIMNGN